MVIRIQGVVRAAKRARQQLRDGMPEGDRSAFLDRVAQMVAEVRELCEGAGGRPGDLPAPSRRAFAELERIAKLAPDDIPLPQGESAPARRLRISNVVRTLDGVLDQLSCAGAGDDRVEAALVPARLCVEAVGSICAKEGTKPAALPARTRSAYALLAWLLEDGNAEAYLERRDAARRALETALEDLGVPPTDALETRVRFVLGSRLLARRVRADHVEVHLHAGFLVATDDEIRDAMRVLILRKRIPVEVMERHRVFTESEDFGAVEREMLLLAGGADDRPKGRVRDLDALFDRLNAVYFDGRLTRPRLHWHDGFSRSIFGFFVSAKDLVCVDDRLDREHVPEFVAEFVLYHELLHRVHRPEQQGLRRRCHTTAFRAAERRHPRRQEAERWLAALARGERRP